MSHFCSTWLSELVLPETGPDGTELASPSGESGGDTGGGGGALSVVLRAGRPQGLRSVVAGGGFWPRRTLVSPSGQGGLGAGHSTLPTRSHGTVRWTRAPAVGSDPKARPGPLNSRREGTQAQPRAVLGGVSSVPGRVPRAGLVEETASGTAWSVTPTGGRAGWPCQASGARATEFPPAPFLTGDRKGGVVSTMALTPPNSQHPRSCLTHCGHHFPSWGLTRCKCRGSPNTWVLSAGVDGSWPGWGGCMEAQVSLASLVPT